MRITPLDIRQHKFDKGMRGYDCREVDLFLQMVAEELENLLLQHHQLEEQLTRQKGQLAELHEKEKVLQETLVAAQKMSAQIKSNAQKEGEVIVGQAEVQAERITNMAYQRLAKLIDELSSMKRQRAQMEAEMRAVIDTHLKLLDSHVATRPAEPGIEDTLRFLKKGERSA